jgi:hypothetical protein
MQRRWQQNINVRWQDKEQKIKASRKRFGNLMNGIAGASAAWSSAR